MKTSSLDNNRITKTFASLRESGKKALLPFITAGQGGLETTQALLSEFAARGVRICELGVPYSDPVADGPIIQSSYSAALEGGVTSDRIFQMVRRFRSRKGPSDNLALIAMVSYAIVYKHGVQAYLKDAAEAGFDGLIIPDLPLGEAAALEAAAAANGLANIMLIAPTTPPRRRLEIAAHSRGFIYYVSIAGITGERTKLPEATIKAVEELRRHTSTPVCVGFGISNPQTVEVVAKVADGAIVGSAIVHRIADAMAKSLPQQELVRQTGEFISELLTPLK